MWRERISTVVLATALLSGGAVAVAAPTALACPTTVTTTPTASACPQRQPTWRCVKRKRTWKGRVCVEWRYY